MITQSKDLLGHEVRLVIDRPMGSKHPEYDFHYPVNYGYVPDTLAGDGEEIDAYLLGVNAPVESYWGVCVAVMRRLNDNEDKLIVVPLRSDVSDEEIRRETYFQERYFESRIIRQAGLVPPAGEMSD